MSIRDNFRTKEEIFRSHYTTLGEISLFGSYEEMCRQKREFMEEDKINNRFELLDL